jgi:hypothetical protein
MANEINGVGLLGIKSSPHATLLRAGRGLFANTGISLYESTEIQRYLRAPIVPGQLRKVSCMTQ